MTERMIPMSEYEALADAFREYADTRMDDPDDVQAALVPALGDDAAFVAAVLSREAGPLLRYDNAPEQEGEERVKPAVGLRVLHPCVGIFEVIEHIGGPYDDWRVRCIEGTEVGRETIVHREYWDRTFLPPSCRRSRSRG